MAGGWQPSSCASRDRTVPCGCAPQPPPGLRPHRGKAPVPGTLSCGCRCPPSLSASVRALALVLAICLLRVLIAHGYSRTRLRLVTPQGCYGYKASNFFRLRGCPGIAKALVGVGEEWGHPKWPFQLDTFPKPSSPFSLCLLPLWQASPVPAAGSEDSLGPGAGAAGSRAERMLILGTRGHCCPCWVCPRRANPVAVVQSRLCARDLGLPSGGAWTGRVLLLDAREHHTPVLPTPTLPLPAPASSPPRPPRVFQGGGRGSSCSRSWSCF